MTTMREAVRAVSPPTMRDGIAERIFYGFGLADDALLQKLTTGVLGRIPTYADASALPLLGTDRLIARGLSEADTSYAQRLRRAFDAWQLAGSARAILTQLLGYLLSATPMVRIVATRYQRPATVFDQIINATNATPIEITIARQHQLAVGASTTVRIWGASPAGLNGSWNAIVTGPRSMTLTGSAAAGVFSGGTNYAELADQTTLVPSTAIGTDWYTYAAGASTASPPTHVAYGGGAPGQVDWKWDDAMGALMTSRWWDIYVIVYSVAPNDWAGTDGTWTDGALWGDGKAWGFSVTADVIASIRAIVALWKAAHAEVRSIIVSRDATLFDPTLPVGAVVGDKNPDGYYGLPAQIVSGVYVASRNPGALYCDGVV